MHIKNRKRRESLHDNKRILLIKRHIEFQSKYLDTFKVFDQPWSIFTAQMRI
jgi:hypothetical protein